MCIVVLTLIVLSLLSESSDNILKFINIEHITSIGRCPCHVQYLQSNISLISNTNRDKIQYISRDVLKIFNLINQFWKNDIGSLICIFGRVTSGNRVTQDHIR